MLELNRGPQTWTGLTGACLGRGAELKHYLMCYHMNIVACETDDNVYDSSHL